MSKRTLQISVDMKKIKRLETLAAAEETSVAAIVRQGINMILRVKETKPKATYTHGDLFPSIE